MIGISIPVYDEKVKIYFLYTELRHQLPFSLV